MKNKHDLELNLESPNLDSASFIMICTDFLSNNSAEPAVIDSIKDDFLHNRIEEAKEKIIQTFNYTLEVADKELMSLITEKAITTRNFDDPLRNNSRRYFDTKLATILSTTTSEPFEHTQKLAALINRRMGRELAPEIINTKIDSDAVIGTIRTIGDDHTETRVRMEGLRADAESLSGSKDRGGKRTPDKLYSRAPGIMKSTSTVPYDEISDETMTNRVTDLFRIDPSKTDGYSASRQTIPFVNSISGTTYALASVLDDYMEENKEDPNLQRDVDNIVKDFISFTCKNGYHSLGEMLDVLKEPAVQKLFHSRGLTPTSLPREVVDKAFETGAQYSSHMALKTLVQQELPATPRDILRPLASLSPLSSSRTISSADSISISDTVDNKPLLAQIRDRLHLITELQSTEVKPKKLKKDKLEYLDLAESKSKTRRKNRSV